MVKSIRAEAAARIPSDWPVITDEYLDELQDAYVAAARLAFEVGFDAVDIKSCHGYLKAIVELLEQGSGSRGSHLVLAADGIEIHPEVLDQATGKSLRFRPENKKLREYILQVTYDSSQKDLFRIENVQPRSPADKRKAFEPIWQDFRGGQYLPGLNAH